MPNAYWWCHALALIMIFLCVLFLYNTNNRIDSASEWLSLRKGLCLLSLAFTRGSLRNAGKLPMTTILSSTADTSTSGSSSSLGSVGAPSSPRMSTFRSKYLQERAEVEAAAKAKIEADAAKAKVEAEAAKVKVEEDRLKEEEETRRREKLTSLDQKEG